MSIVNVSGRRFGPAEPDGRRCPKCIYGNCDGDAAARGLCFDHALAVWAIVQQAHMDLINKVRASGPQPKLPAGPDGVVYIIRLGDRVKIGFTRNLRQRMLDLPHEEILTMVPGTVEDERRCHAAFAHLRVAGEWFRAEPDLLAFAQEVDTRAKLDDR